MAAAVSSEHPLSLPFLATPHKQSIVAGITTVQLKMLVLEESQGRNIDPPPLYSQLLRNEPFFEEKVG
ncbi:DNA glycosylase [Sesbania bispinosa]|nr:DNA glycosylase [Sesbania bispinosa]